jgi:hypothetical protein
MMLKCSRPEGRAIKGFVEFVFADRTSFDKVPVRSRLRREGEAAR